MAVCVGVGVGDGGAGDDEGSDTGTPRGNMDDTELEKVYVPMTEEPFIVAGGHGRIAAVFDGVAF